MGDIDNDRFVIQSCRSATAHPSPDIHNKVTMIILGVINSDRSPDTCTVEMAVYTQRIEANRLRGANNADYTAAMLVTQVQRQVVTQTLS